MKTLPVGELKAQFSEVLEKVTHGESFGILYGKKKKPVAMVVPYRENTGRKARIIGIMDGKARIRFSKDFKITEEEFAGLS
jgi:antitoxin (DNA-binding transcriptional repressor) of toxin-antitoxin stability system